MTAPDNERARIRGVMYEPSSVWLATDKHGYRWLTDQYVMLDVTGAEVIEGRPDGPYQLMATGEWRAEPRNSIPEPDVEAYFGVLARKVSWAPAEPTEWSVAEHPGKAMLWASDKCPCLLGESTWTAIKRHYPGVLVDYGHAEELNIFRFSVAWHDPACEVPDECPGNSPAPFCYAAGIRVPEGQEGIAFEIARFACAT